MAMSPNLRSAAGCFLGLFWMLAGVVQGAEPSFRDLVRKYVQNPQPGAVAALPGVPEGLNKIIALEYTVLLRTPTGEEAVDATKYQFKLGDQIRVRIKPLSGLHIYIFHEGASGERTCLLPTDKETPPLASPDKELELPADGSVFEFSPPAGDEKLIVVALEQPSADLAALSDVIFKKPEDQLTPAEKDVQKQLKAKGSQTLKSILDRQSQSTRYRGLFTDESLANVKGQAAGKTRAVLEEPPHGTQKSTFSLSASKGDDKQGELYVTIPLKSTGK